MFYIYTMYDDSHINNVDTMFEEKVFLTLDITLTTLLKLSLAIYLFHTYKGSSITEDNYFESD